MTTDEHFDGEVHGLLAGAFDDALPVVDLVPGAVDGYRRHRRRARVLGTAGAALAVAGVVAAGATVPSWGGGSSAAQSAAGGGSGAGAAQAATHPSSAHSAPKPAPVNPACHGTAFYKFGSYVGIDWYLGDVGTLQAVCDRDVATLTELIPGATVTPHTETTKFAKQWHDTTATMPLPEVSADAPIVDIGTYDIHVAGHAALAQLDFSTKEWDFDGECGWGQCPPNFKLADGTPARTFSGPMNAWLIVFSDATHTANVSFGDNDRTAKGPEPVPFDSAPIFRSPQFAELIKADTAQLTRLVHN